QCLHLTGCAQHVAVSQQIPSFVHGPNLSTAPDQASSADGARWPDSMCMSEADWEPPRASPYRIDWRTRRTPIFAPNAWHLANARDGSHHVQRHPVVTIDQGACDGAGRPERS